MPSTLLPQQRQRGLDDPKHPKVVRLEQSANVVLARLPNRAHQGVPSIVENDIEPAEVPVSLRNRLTHLFWVRDVERKRQNVVPETFRKDRQCSSIREQ